MKTAPDPKDVQEFQFKQSNTSQIIDAFTSIPIACSLLAADKKRGLLYIGQNNRLLILKPGEDSDPEWKIEVEISIIVSKLMLSCDCSYLAIIPHGPFVLVYDVQALVRGSLQLLHEIRISTTADAFVSDLQWNPTVPGMLCTVASDYTVGSFHIKEDKEKTIELKALERLSGLDVLCAAWSPKGKQIVVGCKNGHIVQLKPDLKVARTIPGPTPYIGEVISILWISNYQFCAAYLGSEQRINVLIVDAPKGEANATFTCYEDITYGITDTEDGTIPRYYFDHVPEWGLIIAASGNSSEIAVLGSTDGGATWNQWQLVDSGRAELPLICTTESYPVGLAIDKSSSRKLPWGAESALPHPVPVLHILATSGQLCSFHMVNLFPNCPAINVPPTEIISTPPQPRASMPPTETSIIMNGLVTSTPRPKQQENVAERPKPAPTANIFDKFLKGTGGFFTQPLAKMPKQQEQKPEICNMEIKVEPPKEIHSVEPIKPDVKLTPIKETVPQAPIEPKTTVEDDSRDIRAYVEEHNLFEKELRNRLEPQTWVECGTEDERRKLVEMSDVIDQFLRELRETTNSLSSDIAYLKALLLQSFAWVEETKSKNAASNDITARNCGDSNKISDLQKLYYYTQTQLTQASKIVDLEWLDSKSHEMSRMRIPHLEFVYQNLILHSKIIQGEKNKVEQLKKRWKLITRSNSMFGLNRSLSNLSVLSSKSSASLPRNAGIIEARCKAIASKTLSFTKGKQMKLRKHLSASTPRVIKPVNPSPIQHRLEATLSSLASPSASTATTDIIASATTVDTKTKLEQPTPKQTPVAKQATEKLKQQSPLASLNVIVARIGANETNNMSAQSKTQTSQPSFTNTFPVATGNKPVQLDKKSSLPVATVAHQSAKPKQDSIIFNQVPSALPNLMKSFPAVSISCTTPMQNSEETMQKSIFTESGTKAGKETVQNTSPFKVESNLFGTGALKGALSTEITAGKAQGITSSPSLNFGVAVIKTTAAAPTNESATTFSFATPIIASTTTKSISQTVAQQTASAQSFSFASKPSSPATILNWKLPSTTAAPQTQRSMNMMSLISGLQAPVQTPVSSSEINVDDKSKSKFILVTSAFEMPLGQAQPASSSVIVSAGTKQTVATTYSNSGEEISSTTESKVPSFPTSSAPSLPATSAARLFANQTNAPSIPIFGEVSSPTPTVATFTATTSSNAFGVQTTTTSPLSIFGGFSSPLATSLSSTATTASGVSPFQTALPKPTFGATAASLSTPSSVSATTSASPTLNFGNITTATTAALPNATTTTTATSVFGKPALPMTTQFSTAPAVSSAANAFGKSVISPASMPFGSSASTSIFGGTPTTTAKTSFFSGGNTSSIFGASTQASSSGNIFGGNTSPVNTFATPQKSVFDNTQKSGSIFGGTSYTTGSFFGGTPPTNTSAGVTSPGSPSVFGNVGASASPLGMEQPVLGGQTAFGQAPSFDTKPVFGSPPAFGASKPPFGGGFGGTAFGATAAPPAFGSPPAMGATPAPLDNMSKVFGNMGSNNTFESLASQSGGLSFSSLAQKSPEAEKPPVFSGGSSFSSWR